jgi:1-deoxy-D-xylulose-5-phosphate reductoisomerase
VFNAVNEECVEAFLGGTLSFSGIVDTVAAVLEEHLRSLAADEVKSALTLDDVLTAETWARRRAQEVLEGAA